VNNLSIRITQRSGEQEHSIDLDLPLFGASGAASTRGECNNPRFTVKDGIVTDHKTGLMWSQDDVTEKPVTHKAAKQACKELRLGGFEDWTLPSREQLLTLVDDTKHDPCINTQAFPSCKSAWYWTSTAYAPSPADCAWCVSFYVGVAGSDYRVILSRVRAVRVAAISPRPF